MRAFDDEEDPVRKQTREEPAASCHRRKFLRRAALGVCAAPLVVHSSVLGREGSPAPSERIRLGLIGIGAMGRGHLRCFLEYPEARVVAVCDVDRWRREHAGKKADEAYAARRLGAAAACTVHEDLREVLDRDDVDAVVIATGDNWHATATVLAAQAGKDIYTEKPISKTVREARAMVTAVRRYGRVFQAGLQQRSTFEFRKACRLVQEGHIGAVKYVYVGFPGTNDDVNLPVEEVPDGLNWDLWLGPAPWRPFNGRFHRYGPPPGVVPWHFCRDFGGGNLTSNTVHAFDVVQWGLGRDASGPVEIIPPETGQVPSLTCKYADGVVAQVTWKLDAEKHFVPEGWDIHTRIQNFGALFVGEKGWIHVGRQGFLHSYPREIVQSQRDESDGWHPVGNHHQDWLASIRSRKDPSCNVETGCRSTTVSHLGCIAHWTRRALKWDPAAERFHGDDEANRLLSRAMREPWKT